MLKSLRLMRVVARNARAPAGARRLQRHIQTMGRVMPLMVISPVISPVVAVFGRTLRLLKRICG